MGVELIQTRLGMSAHAEFFMVYETVLYLFLTGSPHQGNCIGVSD